MMRADTQADRSWATSPRTTRLDRWLWAARFFKTRALAAQAVTGGKVHLNGERTKPSHDLRVGDRLEITRTPDRCAIVVRALSDRRGPASVARTLYAETAASLDTRARHAELRKLAVLLSPAPATRPDKKSRRLIHRFKQGLPR